MKIAWMVIRLALPVSAIVLLGLALSKGAQEHRTLIAAGMLCSVAGLWLNIWFQRKERKDRQ